MSEWPSLQRIPVTGPVVVVSALAGLAATGTGLYVFHWLSGLDESGGTFAVLIAGYSILGTATGVATLLTAAVAGLVASRPRAENPTGLVLLLAAAVGAVSSISAALMAVIGAADHLTAVLLLSVVWQVSALAGLGCLCIGLLLGIVTTVTDRWGVA